MLRQYAEAKAACPDAILMFRMGDFFELFFDDARVAARELDLTLTARDKSDQPIPMAGVPHHAVSGYIARLVDRGYSVALCDQVEDPKLARGLVRREITRVITPGTVADPEALRPGLANYLACIAVASPPPAAGPVGGSQPACELTAEAAAGSATVAAAAAGCGATAGGGGGDGGGGQGGGDACPDPDPVVVIGLLDLLAGELLCTEARCSRLGDELQRMGARELLLPELAPALEAQVRRAVGPQGAGPARLALRPGLAPPAEAACSDLLARRFGATWVAGVPGGGSAAHRQVLAQLIHFAEATQRRQLPHLQAPRAYRVEDFVVLDETTRRALELTATQIDGQAQGSLLWHLDCCRTPMGSRALRHWLMFPLRRRDAIEARLDAVDALRVARPQREALRAALAQVRDVERLGGRVACGRATPRDLAALRQSLGQLPEVAAAAAGFPGSLGAQWEGLDLCAPLADELQRALVAAPPLGAADGGIFARGYCPELDVLLDLASEGHGFLADLEARERARSGIASLKVRYNRVFGYYLEVTRANLAQVPADFVRKQTLVNAERFITAELKAYEEKVLHADERRRTREAELFAALVAQVARQLGPLRQVAARLAQADALAALAEVADLHRYVRPSLDEAPQLLIEAGRHPVVERLLPGGERFVPNDLHLDAASRQLLIVTGPNMAGKSTAMRQAALIAIMAHMGSCVPARRAHVGLVDRLFTRVGAADDLGRGHSTFMVEMMETASILRHVTPSSLVLLDEIGRGTSTFDGVSLAWAVAEYLHDTARCRAMFATHYHELTALSRPRLVNVCVAVAEQDDCVVFLRRLVDGAADRSYGIQVARLAGLPEPVLARARHILAGLEGDGGGGGGGGSDGGSAAPRLRQRVQQLALFAGPQATPLPLEGRLAALDTARMTPAQALKTLRSWQAQLPA